MLSIYYGRYSTSLSLETNDHDECRDNQIDLNTYWKDTEYTCLYFSFDESVAEGRQPNVRLPKTDFTVAVLQFAILRPEDVT
jgi:hypothetical protein